VSRIACTSLWWNRPSPSR